MDKTVLVGPDLEEGKKFLDLLARHRVPVNAALWQKDEFLGRWEFLIVTPLVEQIGIKQTHRRFEELLSKAPERPEIDLFHVLVFTPESSFYKSLRRELRHARDLVITKRSIGDHVVDAGYIYFVK